MTSEWLPAQADQNARRRETFHRVYESLLDDRISPLFYLPGEGLLGLDADGTNDGSHPNDLGASRMVEALEPRVRTILEKR